MKKKQAPNEQNPLKAMCKNLLLHEGYSQKQTAGELGISEKTVCRWVNDPVEGYRDVLDKVRNENMKVKLDMESVSTLEARIRVNKPDWYPTVKQAIDWYRKPNLKAI